MEPRYYKENRTEITERIKSGVTEFFDISLDNSKEKAERFAHEKGTYIYPVFSYVNTGVREKFEVVGYSVPK